MPWWCSGTSWCAWSPTLGTRRAPDTTCTHITPFDPLDGSNKAARPSEAGDVDFAGVLGFNLLLVLWRLMCAWSPTLGTRRAPDTRHNLRSYRPIRSQGRPEQSRAPVGCRGYHFLAVCGLLLSPRYTCGRDLLAARSHDLNQFVECAPQQQTARFTLMGFGRRHSGRRDSAQGRLARPTVVVSTHVALHALWE